MIGDLGRVTDVMPLAPPSREQIDAVFLAKHGDPESAGWAAHRCARYGYFYPSDWYEAVLDRLIRGGTRWLDVGGGSGPFPDNSRLATALAGRCSHFAVVDPSDNVRGSTLATETHQCVLKDLVCAGGFDVLSLRMVVLSIGGLYRGLDWLVLNARRVLIAAGVVYPEH